MKPEDRPSVGELIRRQRELQALSLRQLADLAGISNPYLSQIERGLRDPSKRVLEAIAETLELSADALQGPRPASGDRPAPDSAVVAAINADPKLTKRQRQTLLEIYASFTGAGAPAGD
jgi:transcriptional regulator with XRE-family HTH domain